MKRQIIAIGGGGFGRNPGEGLIENYILQQVDKETPSICFIPTATGDDEGYKNNFYSTFTKLNCNPSHLDFFKRTPDLEELINDQDVIFVGGGNTKSMLAVWKDWKLDEILQKAYKNGVVMSGVSAGAICWFKKGVTDSWAKDLKIMECMGFIHANCCPHYDEEPQRRPSVKSFLENQIMEDCFCIEGGNALHFINEEVLNSVSFGQGKNSYLTNLLDKKIVEKELPRIDING